MLRIQWTNIRYGKGKWYMNSPLTTQLYETMKSKLIRSNDVTFTNMISAYHQHNCMRSFLQKYHQYKEDGFRK